jgi:predicted DNA binding CopG/RHH family protein
MNHNGRQKKQIKRIEQVTVRFTTAELEAIESKAKYLKIPRTELIRNLVVKHIDDFNYMH